MGHLDAILMERWPQLPMFRLESTMSQSHTHLKNFRFVTLALIGLLAYSGCGLDSPEAPTFQTDIHIPIGRMTYTVADLIESVDLLEGDTTGTYPVYLAFDGTIDSIGVEDRLSADIAPVRLAVEIGDLPLDIATISETFLPLTEISPIEIPPGGVQLIVPPFDFYPLGYDLEPFPEFEEGSLRSGTLEISLTNELPIAFEGLEIALEDVRYGSEIASVLFTERVEPGSQVNRFLDMSGKTVSNAMRIHIVSGSSPGSTTPVVVNETDGVRIRASLNDLKFQQLKAPFEPRTYQKADSTRIDADIQILQARIAQTTIPLRLESRISVPVIVRVTLPNLELDGGDWSRSYSMEAGSIDRPYTLISDEEIDGGLISFPEVTSPQRLQYLLEVEYAGSRGEVVELSAEMGASVELGAFRLRLDELTGIVIPQELEIEPTTTEISIPDETEGIEFLEADLTLEIINEVQIPGFLNLTATGTGVAGSVDLHLQGSIAAATTSGPVMTSITWNETNRSVIDLVNVKPEEIVAGGTILVGDSSVVSTISSHDRIYGTYTIRAPAKMKISDASYDSDPFDIGIDEEMRDRIRNDVLGAEATLKVSNHLPVGVSVTLQFSDDSTNVYDRPSIVLDTIHVPSGTLDEATGRVAEASISDVHVALSADQIDFFAGEYVWVGTAIRADPTGDNSIELLTTDHVEVEGLIRFGFEVGPE